MRRSRFAPFIPLRLLLRGVWLWCLVFRLLPLRAQTTDEQLAAQYFQQGDYVRATLYYERLYKRTPGSFYYEQYFKCLTGQKEYGSAEKLVKDQLKRYGNDPRYMVDLGGLYRMMGEDEKAEQQYDKAIKELPANASTVRQVANAFVRANETDRALRTYERGSRLVQDEVGFQSEMAELYAAKGDIPAMVRSYLDLLTVNEGYLQQVQSGLGRSIDLAARDARSDALRTELLRRIQREPDNVLLAELLIWMYTQQKDWTAALVQSKALDKRLQENGQRLLELGALAAGARDYSAAVRCYEYALELGRTKPAYADARMGLIQALDAQVAQQAEPPLEDLHRLEATYLQALEELGRTVRTVDLLQGLANLQAYYLGMRTQAITTLQEAIALPSLDPKRQAALKLLLGDVYVLGNDIWEASLLYSQVDLAYKHDMLGHDARLRNAKVSFYAGDLLWCQAQLDVLKASTSKLIANDAMELSLLIGDNIGADSNSAPLHSFARAQLLTFQHNYPQALLVLDSLDLAFPMHSIADEVLFERFRIAKLRREFPTAAGHLQKLLELYPLDILADNALYQLGILCEEHLQDPEKARGYFERLLFEQPGSIFVPDARERYRRLRGDTPPPEEPAPSTP
jgi:tetratricopeptide (TPR) repeat protein